MTRFTCLPHERSCIRRSDLRDDHRGDHHPEMKFNLVYNDLYVSNRKILLGDLDNMCEFSAAHTLPNVALNVISFYFRIYFYSNASVDGHQPFRKAQT